MNVNKENAANFRALVVGQLKMVSEKVFDVVMGDEIRIFEICEPVSLMQRKFTVEAKAFNAHVLIDIKYGREGMTADASRIEFLNYARDFSEAGKAGMYLVERTKDEIAARCMRELIEFEAEKLKPLAFKLVRNPAEVEFGYTLRTKVQGDAVKDLSGSSYEYVEERIMNVVELAIKSGVSRGYFELGLPVNGSMSEFKCEWECEPL
ncbi:hypothetical protein [Vibrio owensii]|uniref:hypothetical protein n=1 Tax=Vibrio owensii TaxID=696485 RepID=UPI0018F18FCE|nr:hypothetical protein [Vibrio owensii]